MAKESLETKIAVLNTTLNAVDKKVDKLAGSFEDLKNNFVTREEMKTLLADVNRVKITLYGANMDGEKGIVSEVTDVHGSIKSIWKTIAIYTALLTPTIGFLVYLLIDHIKNTLN